MCWLKSIWLTGGVDFNTKQITTKFTPGEVSKTFNISVNCDKIPENEETFDISLKLTDNDPRMRTGINTSIGIIRDITGKWNNSDYRNWI